MSNNKMHIYRPYVSANNHTDIPIKVGEDQRIPAASGVYVSPPPSPPAPTITCPTTIIPLPIPIILILGPPGSGKGTLSARLSTTHNLHHFSVGDWLRAQTKPPIAHVPLDINRYVSAGEAVPEDLLILHYRNDPDLIPLPLLLYNSGKNKVSTPSEMWIRALPDIRRAFENIVADKSRTGVCAILLDNFPKTLAHALAAEKVFGDGFPNLVIDVQCPEEVAAERFLARKRGGDDVDVFRRRFARHEKGSGAVRDFYEQKLGESVSVDAVGEPEEVHERLMGALEDDGVWREVVGGEE